MDNENIDFEDLLVNRIVESSQDVTLSSLEKEYLEEVLKTDKFLSKYVSSAEFFNSIEVIEKTFSYYIYTFKTKEVKHYLKIGTEADKIILSKEHNVIKNLKDADIAPKIINFGYGSNYSYLLTNYQSAPTISEIGIGEIITNYKKPFLKFLSNFHNSNIKRKNQKYDFLQDLYDTCDFSYILGDENVRLLLENELTCKLLRSTEEIINILQTQADHIEKKACVCHLDLNDKNIIFNYEKFKLVNFNNSYNLDPHWDMAFLSINLGLDKFLSVEEDFVNIYNSYSKKNKLSYSSLQDFKSCAFKIILLKIITSFIYRLADIKLEDDMIDLTKNYINIRPFIQHEMSAYLDVLDQFFYQT